MCALQLLFARMQISTCAIWFLSRCLHTYVTDIASTHAIIRVCTVDWIKAIIITRVHALVTGMFAGMCTYAYIYLFISILGWKESHSRYNICKYLSSLLITLLLFSTSSIAKKARGYPTLFGCCLSTSYFFHLSYSITGDIMVVKCKPLKHCKILRTFSWFHSALLSEICMLAHYSLSVNLLIDVNF